MRRPVETSMNSEYSAYLLKKWFLVLKCLQPLLERKRRARINRCLDELKELMVHALQSEGENVAKLEKVSFIFFQGFPDVLAVN